MGLFSQKQQDPAAWAALPGEPLDETNPNERLDEAPPVDLIGLGLGGTSTVITIPSAEPEASGEPEGETPAAAEASAD
ncbi:hypothetical protein [uncultured Microbacterium sp.]|uniref:hypothetical protein n=1 Tax=uncultured Microbacterium sp. TaxID=191216 RepID=UPI002625FD7B|nr:hypothetical protein [uncultured Microbacterium sp.]